MYGLLAVGISLLSCVQAEIILLYTYSKFRGAPSIFHFRLNLAVSLVVPLEWPSVKMTYFCKIGLATQRLIIANWWMMAIRDSLFESNLVNLIESNQIKSHAKKSNLTKSKSNPELVEISILIESRFDSVHHWFQIMTSILLLPGLGTHVLKFEP